MLLMDMSFRCTSRTRRQGRTPSVSKSSSREGAVCVSTCLSMNLLLLSFDSDSDWLIFPSPLFSQGEYRLQGQAETNQDKNKYNTPKYRFVVRFVSLKDSSSVHHSLCTSQLSIYVAYVAYYYHRVMLYLLTLVL